MEINNIVRRYLPVFGFFTPKDLKNMNVFLKHPIAWFLKKII